MEPNEKVEDVGNEVRELAGSRLCKIQSLGGFDQRRDIYLASGLEGLLSSCSDKNTVKGTRAETRKPIGSLLESPRQKMLVV